MSAVGSSGYKDFLSDGGGGGDDNASNDSQSTTSSVGSNNSSKDKPMMQLPRVGWGTDDDNEDENGSSNSVNSTGVELPSINNNNQHQNKEKGVIIRSSTRNHTEGGESLPPIPEERSMHGGIWSDYCYPDYYDYDRRKYRRCGPYFKQRLLAIILILGIGAFIGYRLGTGRAADTPHKQLPEQQTDSDNNDEQKYDYPTKEQLPPGMDIYHVIIDTLDPQMFDASSDTQSSWDGSFFHSFEFWVESDDVDL